MLVRCWIQARATTGCRAYGSRETTTSASWGSEGGLVRRQARHSDPSFYPHCVSSSNPNILCNLGLGGVIHRAWGGTQPPPPPPELVAAACWRDTSQSTRALLGYPLQSGWCTRATSISPRTTVTPYPASHYPAMVRMGRKDYNPGKANKNKNQIR